jgi:hypothetical protein
MSRIGFWMSIGGQRHDLDELARDEPLQQWLRQRPALVHLPDRTLAQHTGSDSYLELAGLDEPDPVTAINTRVRDLLEHGGEATLWNVMSGPNVFPEQPIRLERWLELTDSRRVVFGHKPHRNSRPERYHGGKAINYDGGLSRAHRLYRSGAALTGSVGPLPD